MTQNSDAQERKEIVIDLRVEDFGENPYSVTLAAIELSSSEAGWGHAFVVFDSPSFKNPLSVGFYPAAAEGEIGRIYYDDHYRSKISQSIKFLVSKSVFEGAILQAAEWARPDKGRAVSDVAREWVSGNFSVTRSASRRWIIPLQDCRHFVFDIFTAIRMNTLSNFDWAEFNDWNGRAGEAADRTSAMQPKTFDYPSTFIRKIVAAGDNFLERQVILAERNRYLYGDVFRSEEFVLTANPSYVERILRSKGMRSSIDSIGIFLQEKPYGYGVLMHSESGNARGRDIGEGNLPSATKNLIDATIAAAVDLDNPEIGELHDPAQLSEILEHGAVYVEKHPAGYLVQDMEDQLWQQLMPSLIKATLVEERHIRGEELSALERAKFAEFRELSRIRREAERRDQENAADAGRFPSAGAYAPIDLSDAHDSCGVNCLRYRMKLE